MSSSRRIPRDSLSTKLLGKRTLTKLYNDRPTWLDLAHRELDQAVFAAYGWDSSLSDVAILEGLLALNLEREAAQAGSQAAEEELEEDEELAESG